MRPVRDHTDNRYRSPGDRPHAQGVAVVSMLIAVVLLTMPSTLQWDRTQFSGWSERATAAAPAASVDRTVNNLGAGNETACGLLSGQYTPTAILPNVTALFDEVCELPHFVALIQNWGASNFTMYYATANGTWTLVAFLVDWVRDCPSGTQYFPATACVFEE